MSPLGPGFPLLPGKTLLCCVPQSPKSPAAAPGLNLKVIKYFPVQAHSRQHNMLKPLNLWALLSLKSTCGQTKASNWVVQQYLRMISKQCDCVTRGLPQLLSAINHLQQPQHCLPPAQHFLHHLPPQHLLSHLPAHLQLCQLSLFKTGLMPFLGRETIK